MNILKAILTTIYPLLILLLLLADCSRCVNDTRTTDPINSVDAEEVRDSVDAVRQAQDTGNSGDLKVTLLWDFPGDIDLHIVQPNGCEINYSKKRDTRTGGFLDVDNVNGGAGSAENIYWENPPNGSYKIFLKYYQKSELTKVAGSGVCTVVVFQKGKSPETFNVPMSVVGEIKDVVSINI